MAKTLGTLVVDLEANTASFNRDMKKADDNAKQFSKNLLAAGAAVGAAAAVGVAAFGVAAIKSATDSAEAFSKFETVFGAQTARMQEFIDELTLTVPVTVTELRTMTASLQDLLVPMGVAPELALLMNEKFVTLAGDLASFNNIPVAQALEKIRAGLVGSSEPLLAFGVDVRATAVATRALELGLIAEGEAVDNASRAQAVLSIALEQSTFAIGDAARTANSAANQMRFLSRDFEEVTDTVGRLMLPVFTQIVSMLVDFAAALRSNSERLVVLGRVMAFPVQIFLAFEKGVAKVNIASNELFISILELVQGANNLLGALSPFPSLSGNIEGHLDQLKLKVLNLKGDVERWEERQIALVRAVDDTSDSLANLNPAVDQLADESEDAAREIGDLSKELSEFKDKQDKATAAVEKMVGVLPLYQNRQRFVTGELDAGTGAVDRYEDASIGLWMTTQNMGIPTLTLARKGYVNLSGALDDGAADLKAIQVENNNVIQSQKTLVASTDNMASRMGDQISSIATDFSAAFADIIFDGRNFGEAMVSIFTSLGKTLLRTVVEEIITPIVEKFAEFIGGLFSNVADAIPTPGGGGGAGGGGGLFTPTASFTELGITGVAIQTGIFGTGVGITGVTIQSGTFNTGFELRLGPTFKFGGEIAEGIDTNVARIQQELEFILRPTFRHVESLTFNIEASIKTVEAIARAGIMPALARIAGATEGILSHLQTGTTNVNVSQPVTVNISDSSVGAVSSGVGAAVSDANRALIDAVTSAIQTNQQGLRSEIQNAVPLPVGIRRLVIA